MPFLLLSFIISFTSPADGLTVEVVGSWRRPPSPAGTDGPLGRFAKPATIQEKESQLEDEALVIDAELERSEHLIIEAWGNIQRAPLILLPSESFGRHMEQDRRSIMTRIRDLAGSAPACEWYFFAFAIALVITVDLVILQHLPEIERTHVGILIFWLIVSASFCGEVWVRQGQKEGISWASGYLLEFIFSIKNVFIFNLIFQTLETPRRLMRKALMVAVLGSVVLRFAFHIGLAAAICNISFLSYLLGVWLIYCGTQQVAVGGRCDEEATDVTQTLVVRFFRSCLGGHFGEFYDEEGEALFLVSGKKYCMTLLGAAVICLLTTDFLFGPDATLVKSHLIPNAYLSMSSSVFALFTLRAVFSVVRDVLSHLSLARYCTGLILVFVGAEMLVARFTQVSALMSLVVVANVVMMMAMFSAVRDGACPKRIV